MATRARELGGRQRPAIDGRLDQLARGGGPGAAREGRPVSARPRQSPLRPPPRSRCSCSCERIGGVRGREPLFAVDVGRGHESGRGRSSFPAPARRGPDPRSPRLGPLGGEGGRCGRVGGEGARTPERSAAGSLPPRPSPLSAPHLPPPQLALAQPLSPPPPRRSPTHPPPPAPTPTPSPDSYPPPSAAPPPVLSLAQSGFGAPGPGLHAANWAARAGAEARGCSFTRSLKYFGKPQSGVARKWPLACFREPGREVLRTWAKRGQSDRSQISEVCPP